MVSFLLNDRGVRQRRLVFAACVAALFACLLPALPIEAHAALKSSDPAANEVLDTPPSTIRIVFTEPLEPALSGADLLNASGEIVPGVSTRVSPTDAYMLEMTTPPDLPDGEYTVSWHNVSSADGHGIRGFFAFGVGLGAGGGGTAASGLASAPERDPVTIFAAAARWLAFLGLALAIAVWPIWLLVVRPAAARTCVLEFAANRASPFATWAVVAAVIGSLLQLVAQVALSGAGSGLSGLGVTLQQTRFGWLWLIRIGVLLLLGLCLRFVDWQQPGRRKLLAAGAVLASLTAPVPFSLISHAAAESTGTMVAVGADALHVLAGGVWFGGLVGIVTVLFPLVRSRDASPRAVLGAIAPRFSALAVPAWIVLVATGLYAAWLHVGSWDALWPTLYGQALIVKLLLIAPVLVLAAMNLLLLEPKLIRQSRGQTEARVSDRFRGAVRWEAILAVMVFAVTGFLTMQEPAIEVRASQQPVEYAVPITLNGDTARQATLRFSPGAAGENTYTLEVAGKPLPDAEALLRIALPAHGLPPRTVTLAPSAENQWTGSGNDFAVAGDWTVETIVRDIGSYQFEGAVVAAVPATPAFAVATSSAPRFEPLGAAALVLAAVGLVCLGAGAGRAEAGFRRAMVAGGSAVLAAGIAGLILTRLPTASPSPVVAANLAMVPAGTPERGTPAARPPLISHEMTEMVGMDHEMMHASPVPEPGARPGTAVAAGDLRVTLEPFTTAPGVHDLTLVVRRVDGAPVDDASVTVIPRMEGMSSAAAAIAAEARGDGRYHASNVTLNMTGPWRLTVRVAPRGAASASVIYEIDIH